jgi:hypothetical protein
MSLIARTSRRTLAVMRVIVLAGLLVACGDKEPTLDDVIKTYVPPVEPMLTVLEKIAKAPLPAATGTISLAGGPPLIVSSYIDGPKLVGNAAMAFYADLADLGTYGSVDELRTSDYSVVNDCWRVARKGEQAARAGAQASAPWPQVARDWLKRCSLMRYLVVMKVTTLQGTKYVDKEQFGGGFATADVLVFDLKTGAYLGGVQAAAESSTVTRDPAGDLRNKFYDAVRSAITKQLPDATIN